MPADLKGERVEDYYEILEELGRYVYCTVYPVHGCMQTIIFDFPDTLNRAC